MKTGIDTISMTTTQALQRKVFLLLQKEGNEFQKFNQEIDSSFVY